jgi:uncharacterized protein YecT (DUF1311 family)
MQGSIRRALRFVVLSLQVAPLCAVGQKPSISEDEIKKHFSLSPECEGIHIDHLEYFDFTGTGADDAVVVASTCATGTAGSDVHAVLHRQPDGSLAELRIPEPTEKQYAVLFCRCFYDLNVIDGLLTATYHDQSGRDDPLVVKYRWSAQEKEFRVAEVKTSPRYKASFDCEKAKTAVENAICSSSAVASLDQNVDARYKLWLDQLNNADSDVLTKEQREWLRKRNLICGNDSQIFDCLEILYRARMLELEHFKHLHP